MEGSEWWITPAIVLLALLFCDCTVTFIASKKAIRSEWNFWTSNNKWNKQKKKRKGTCWWYFCWEIYYITFTRYAHLWFITIYLFLALGCPKAHGFREFTSLSRRWRGTLRLTGCCVNTPHWPPCSLFSQQVLLKIWELKRSIRKIPACSCFPKHFKLNEIWLEQRFFFF